VVFNIQLGYTSGMAGKKKNKGKPSSTIALNKKARYDYFIEKKYEAGIQLQGWEVKSLREGRVQLQDAYIFVKDNEVWMSNCIINPLPTVSTHFTPEPARIRKLLLHRREIDQLIGAKDRQGYTLVPLALFWKRGKVKLEMATAKGKKAHDKRATSKDRDWKRQKERIMKHG
jgi:SsrA-binding protein